MSNNRTVIPGLNDASASGATRQNQNYFQQPSPFNPAQATVIPGVQPAAAPSPAAQQAGQGQIVGFLFSVSKTLGGEYWPIMLGANTLGRGEQNSIVLSEATVSETHASIHVISRANRLIVYIKDDQSKTGTLLNGELLRGEADLKNGDIITIGERYELYVIIVNVNELGLAVNPEFVATEQQSQPATMQMAPQTAFMPPMGSPAPFGAPVSRPVTSGTVVEGSAGSAPVGGHTVIMGGPKL